MKHVLTVVAARSVTSLTAGVLSALRDAVEGAAPDILSPGEAADLPCPTLPDPDKVRRALGSDAIDAIAVPVANRRKRLLVADMDSTIVTTETLDELGAQAGLHERIAAITRRSMNGEIDFAEALRRRVALLKGLDLAALENTWRGTRVTPGAAELVATMRAHGAVTALVSGGFTYFTGRVAAQLGFDVHRANVLLDDGQALTGKVGEPILDRHAKLDEMRRLCATHDIPPADVLAVGDGANDLDMLGAAGLGVAFHAKPVVTNVCRTRVSHTDLRALLFVQGYRVEEISLG